MPQEVFRFGVYEVDVCAGELRKQGTRVRLQEQPFQILVILLERYDAVVTREELRQRLWPADTFVDFDHSLNTAINKLREALNDSADHPLYIETLPRRGYRFIAPLVVPEPPEPPPPIPEPPDGHTDKGEPSPGPRGNIARWLLTAVLVLALGISMRGGWDRLREWLRLRGGERIESIAVIPLVNLTGDEGQEYFVDGMTDALITELAQISALRTISRTSVMQYKNTRKLLPEIARELKVEGIVEGSVQRFGNRVHITIQLLYGPKDRHLWANTYERDISEVAALQGEVARAIAEEIRIQVTPKEREQLARARTVNPDALEAYLKGRYFWNKRAGDSIPRSMEYFNQAIRLDPNYALPYAGLADAFNTLAFYGGMPTAEATARGKAAARKALELDPTLAEAHTALANFVFDHDWDWAAAEAGYRKAIESNPGYPTAHQWYATALTLLGRLDEGRKEYEHALDLDPVSPVIAADAVSYYYYSRQFDQALDQCRKALELDAGFALAHVWCARAYLEKKMYPEALASFEKAAELQPNLTLMQGLLGHAYAVAGQQAKARQILARLTQAYPHGQASPALISMIHWGLGEREQSRAWAERAYHDHDVLLTRLKMDPALEDLRADQRFRDLLERMGFQAAAASPKKAPKK